MGSTCNSFHDLATTTAVSEMGEISDLGHRRERQITQVVKVPKRSSHTFVPARETPSEMSKQEKVKSRLECARLSHSEATSLKGELTKLFEEKVAQTRLSEAEYLTRRLLEEQRDYLLSEAQKELDERELSVECADSSS